MAILRMCTDSWASRQDCYIPDLDLLVWSSHGNSSEFELPHGAERGILEQMLVLACELAGCVTLLAGALTYRPVLRGATVGHALIAFSPVLVAAPLSVFSMEHFLDASDIAGLVPAWMPFHLFWTYAVGVALLAAALSFVIRKEMRWSALSLTILFTSIVLTIQVPNAWAHRQERLYWNALARDTLFTAGTLVLTLDLWRRDPFPGLVSRFAVVGRVLIAAVLLFFSVEHFLFPEFAPGIPLPLRTPAWVPLPRVWAYLTGVAFLAAALGLVRKQTLKGSVLLAGGTLLALTVFLYLPILLAEFRSPKALQAINYIFDTMLAAGTVLLCGRLAIVSETNAGLSRKFEGFG